jgi:hypothetical protein
VLKLTGRERDLLRHGWVASFNSLLVPACQRRQTKKADVAGHPKVVDHVGLLANEPPDTLGPLFI